jgi:TPR repeat protein
MVRLCFALAAACLLSSVGLVSGAYVQLSTDSNEGDPELIQGFKFYEQKSYAKAVAIFERAATAGKPGAMFAMGLLYQEGSGVDRNIGLAETWYERASAKGSGPAMFNLAQILLSRPAAQAKGFEWLRKAAEANVPLAQLNMGKFLASGVSDLLKADAVGASVFLIRALENGIPEAAFELSVLYEKGLDGTPDVKKAQEYLDRACDAKLLPALLYAARKYLTAGSEHDITVAREYLQRAADQGAGQAHFALGELYEVGKAGLSQDYKKALECYQRASGIEGDNQEPLAFNKIAYFYENGHGVEKDGTKALEWYQKGADRGVLVSMYNLGILLEMGRFAGKDEKRGLELITKAAVGGFGAAQNDLGLRYRQGIKGMPRDPVAAMAWLDRAGRGGSVSAQYYLGEMLQHGEAGPADPAGAIRLYKQATGRGSVDARLRYAEALESGVIVPQDLVAAYALYASVITLEGDTDAVKKIRELGTKKVAEFKAKLTPAQLKAAEDLMSGKAPPAAAGAAGPK